MTSFQTICLCMIVRDESQVIQRCIDSVRPIITHWLIVDTGSKDGTQDIIREHLRDLPGELVERKWKDFAHNRSEALALARPLADYSFIIDADDVLECPPGFTLGPLTADAYTVNIKDDPLVYPRTQLVSNRFHWYYRGVLHEFITADETHETRHLDISIIRNHDGARRRDPTWFRRDAETFEKALATEKDPYLRSRYTFYLAQSYRDGRELDKSLQRYLERATLGGWEQEVYVSLYQAAKLKEQLGHPEQDVIAAYENATRVLPSRIEAAHGASRFCRQRRLYLQGYEIASRSIGKPMPKDGLFVESWIYETGLLDEYAVNASWIGQYAECLDACLKILAEGKLAPSDVQRVAANARFASEQLRKTNFPWNLGSRSKPIFLEQHRLGAPRQLHNGLVSAPRVLIAILAKQKERALPGYLECIEALDYPKSSIVLYIRTNNNKDNTEQILRDWVSRVGHLYAGVEFNAENVEDRVEDFGVHEWNTTRFKVLGRIRNVSLRKAVEHGCAFYFVCDVDNFVRPATLAELVALNLPIVAPFLRSLAEGRFYSNYHAEIDAKGYDQECDQYHWILNRWVRGVFEVPVVHCTYLIRADVIDRLTYEDDSGRFEYVIFSHSARKAGIPQYLDNRQVYGYISFDEGGIGHVEGGFELARQLMREGETSAG